MKVVSLLAVFGCWRQRASGPSGLGLDTVRQAIRDALERVE